MITSEKKAEIVKEFGENEQDTGSSEVQVALLTFRIRDLQSHFDSHKKDHHSRRGLIGMVNARRKHLDYIKKRDLTKYQDIIKKLELRK